MTYLQNLYQLMDLMFNFNQNALATHSRHTHWLCVRVCSARISAAVVVKTISPNVIIFLIQIALCFPPRSPRVIVNADDSASRLK